MEVRSGFAERFAEAMALRGVTEAEVGKALGVSQQTVNNWKLGKTGSKRMYDVAQHLRVNADWLIKGEGPRESSQMDDEFVEKMKQIDDPDVREALLNMAKLLEKR